MESLFSLFFTNLRLQKGRDVHEEKWKRWREESADKREAKKEKKKKEKKKKERKKKRK